MSRKKLSLWRMTLCLGLITLLSGSLLGIVYTVTKDPIARAADHARSEAIAAVTPPFDTVEAAMSMPDGCVVIPVTMGGKQIGAAVESVTDQGFSGEIRIMFGFDMDGNVTGYQVLSHAETPGLGAKMDTWFCQDEGQRSIIGRKPAETPMKVSKDGGDVDAITAATITSRAFLDAANRAGEAFTASLKP